MGQTEPWRAWLAALALAPGCAVVHIAGPVNYALLDHPGQVEVGGAVGTTEGVGVSYAVADGLALRAEAGGQGLGEGEGLWHVGTGVGYWGARTSSGDLREGSPRSGGGLPLPDDPESQRIRGERGIRYGANLDVSLGHVHDAFDHSADLTDTDSTDPRVYSAYTASVGLAGYFGYRWPHAQIGGNLALVEQVARQDARSSGIPYLTSGWLFVEPTAIIRVGARPVWFEAQVGASAGVYPQGSDTAAFETYFPIVATVGLRFELDGPAFPGSTRLMGGGLE